MPVTRRPVRLVAVEAEERDEWQGRISAKCLVHLQLALAHLETCDCATWTTSTWASPHFPFTLLSRLSVFPHLLVRSHSLAGGAVHSLSAHFISYGPVPVSLACLQYLHDVSLRCGQAPFEGCSSFKMLSYPFWLTRGLRSSSKCSHCWEKTIGCHGSELHAAQELCHGS